MRLLTVGNMYPPHHLGGYELVWRGAVEDLRARGDVARVLTTDTRFGHVDTPDDPDVHRDLRWYWRDHEWPEMSRREVAELERHNARLFARHLDDLRPDAVLWWSMGGMSLALLAQARAAGVPSAAFVHDRWPAYAPHVDKARVRTPVDRLLRRAPAFSVEQVDRWVFVSDFIRRSCEEALGRPFPGASVAPSGIDEAFLDPRDPPAWGWRLLYVGRIDPRKGIETAIAALDALPNEATLTVVGAGDSTPAAGPRVRFAGPLGVKGLKDAYAAADVVVFPAIWEEPWGLVPLEAMAMGRPVVATARGGSAEYLRDGENALVFEAGDAAALAAAVRRLADDGELRARLREGGLATARRHTAGTFNAAVRAVVDSLRG